MLLLTKSYGYACEKCKSTMGIEPMTFGNRLTENRCGKPLRYVPNTPLGSEVSLPKN